MIIREKENEIFALYIPFVRWLIAPFILVIFSVCLYILLTYAFRNPVSVIGLDGAWYAAIANALWFLFIVAICIGGVVVAVMFILAPVTEVRVNAETQTVDIIYRRFFHKTQERFFFSQIKKFAVIREKEIYRNTLKLVNNKNIEFESFSHSKKSAGGLASKFNNFLEKHNHPTRSGKTGRTTRKRKSLDKMKEFEK